jgi:putative SOS response-associated peptidase YedK
MCGRYSAGQLSLPLLAERFQADPAEAEAAGHQPNWNVAPTSKVLVVTSVQEALRDGDRDGDARQGVAGHTGTDTEDGADAGGPGRVAASRRLRRLRWGLVPGWAKDPKVGNRMINVRSETVTDKPTFKRLLAHKRCILPADGFYEWEALSADPDHPDAGPGRRRQRKQPFYITARDGGPLALAGLWTTNNHADPAGPVETCTILTTSANQLMSSIHHRMPVILPEAAWDTWLDPDLDDLDALTELLVPAPDDLLQMWPVDPAVNSPRSNSPELTRPLEGHEPRGRTG